MSKRNPKSPSGSNDNPGRSAADPGATAADESAADGEIAGSEVVSDDQDGHPHEEWPALPDDLSDELLELLRAAFAATDADAIHALLRTLPREPLQYVMHSLGLSKAAKLNRGMASALLARLRSRPAVDVVRFMFFPFVYAFDHAHVTAEQWREFLEGDWEAVVSTLEGSPEFAEKLNGLILFPEDMQRAALAVTAITSGNWVPALALLAVEDAAAADLYARVRDAHDGLPVAVRTLHDSLPPALAAGAPDGEDSDRVMRAVAGGLFDEYAADTPGAEEVADVQAEGADTSTGDDEDPGNGVLDQSESTASGSEDRRQSAGPRRFFGSLADQSLRTLGSRTLGASDRQSDSDADTWTLAGWGLVAAESQGADAGALIASADSLDWETAAATATRVRDHLEAGDAPVPADVNELTRFTRLAHAVADRLTVHVQHAVDPSARSIAAAVSDLRKDDEDSRLLRGLATVSGPAGLDGPLAEIRDLASAAVAGDSSEEEVGSLVALGRLAELGITQRESQSREYEQIALLEAAARRALPASVTGLLTAATLGDLNLGAHAAVPAPASDAPTDLVPELAAGGTLGAADAADENVSASAAQPDLAAAPVDVPADTADAHDEAAADSELPEGGADEGTGDAASAGDDEASSAASDDSSTTATTDAAADSADDPADDSADDSANDAADGAADDVEFDLGELEKFLSTPAAKSARIRKEPAPATPPAPPQLVDESRDHVWVADAAVADEQSAGPGGDETHAALRVLEARLLDGSRFGLASMLHHDEAHAAARRLAAYGALLTSATGDLATAFADDQPLITRDALGGDQPGQILAWAAAARVSVLAPASAAHQVLLELAPRVADYPNLTQLGADLATASLNGAIAVPDHGQDVAHHHEAVTAVQDAVTAARNLLSVAAQRNIKYLPANGVYQDWMAPDGLLGELLGTVVANNPGDAGDTQRKIVELRRNVDRLITDTAARVLRGPSKNRRIEAGARQTLIKRFEEALDLVSAWVNATITESEISDRLKGAARAQRPLENLRRSVSEVRAGVLDELEHLRHDCDTSTDTGRLEAAAATAAFSMVVATFAAIDGNPPTGVELAPAWVVRSELLATDVSLDPRTLHARPLVGLVDADPQDFDREKVEHEAAVALAMQPAPALGELYATRAARSEHDLTDVIVGAALRLDEQTGVQLRVEREEAVSTDQAAVSVELEDTVSTVNVLRREETLPESVWSSLLADLEALKSPQRRDFATIRAELERVRSVVEKHKSSLMTQARERIEAKAASDPLVAQHRQTLLDVVDRGDVAGADEYLEQLTSGADLPDGRDDGRALREFFPAVPDLVSANPGLLSELHGALSGKEITAPVRELFQIVGTDPTRSSTAGRTAARAALGAWAPLAGLNTGKQRIEATAVIKPILASLGLEFTHSVELDAERPSGRRFGTIREILPTGGKAMVPAMGSHMGGPGGRSLRLLLVWRAETPATILEWLSHERADQTVLVLYLAGSLTSDQRRALASGARGRPRPVSIVVDSSLLAYLACQPEPSRTALAFTTLPFTAASPYRDTPGDTPPEMFYGRFSELRDVLDLVGSSFVSGGRQLGKSALLRSAQRAFEKQSSARRALFVEVRQIGADGRPEAIWPRLAAELRSEQIAPETSEPGTATAESVSETISTWLREDPERALLILIDEADNFLHADADDNFTHVGACKELMTQQQRRVKFVFAGLHRTARFESLSNQPLAHMGKPIVVGPLQPQAAQDLITRPMAAMGFTFENARTQTARILAATNSVPSLLQLFGEALIEHMTAKDVEDGPPQRVTDEDISTVLDNKELVEAFREKYILTLNLDHRYQVIVHAVALAAHDNGVDSGLRLSEISDQCRQYWPAGFADLSVDYLRGLVTECCDLGLLTLDDGRYRMRTPYVLRLLGTADEVAEVLYGAEEQLELRSTFDAGSYRDPIPGTTHRSPLTARQLGELFSEAGKTHLVVGTEALGISWAVSHLVGYADRGRAGEFQVQPIKQWTPESLRSHARMLTKPTMLVFDMRAASATQVAAVLAAETDARAATKVPLTLLILVTPLSLTAWAHEDDRIVELSRVDHPGMKLWCEEQDATFDTPAEWDDLAATTGGWPSLLEKALDPQVSPGSTPTKRLAELRVRLNSREGAAEVVSECGLSGTDQTSAALLTAFQSVAYWTEDGPAASDDLIDFLSEDESLRALVKAAGFDVATALRALLSIGAVLTTSSPGSTSVLVTTEPVLGAAVRYAHATTDAERAGVEGGGSQ